MLQIIHDQWQPSLNSGRIHCHARTLGEVMSPAGDKSCLALWKCKCKGLEWRILLFELQNLGGQQECCAVSLQPGAQAMGRRELSMCPSVCRQLLGQTEPYKMFLLL